MGKRKSGITTSKKNSLDLRARSKIVMQKAKAETLSQDEKRKNNIGLNRALTNLDSQSSEYDFMLPITRKSSFRKAIMIMTKRIVNIDVFG